MLKRWSSPGLASHPRWGDLGAVGPSVAPRCSHCPPCYHLACDTYDNINVHAFDVNTDAVAFATLTYAYSTESVNGVPGKIVPGSPSGGPSNSSAGYPGGASSGLHDDEPVSE